MRFMIHGAASSAVCEALAVREHACHALSELGDEGAASAAAGDAAAFLKSLEKRRWNLVTTDRGLVREVYEKKVAFDGVIVLLAEEEAGGGDAGRAVARLFERYRRLTPGRLYTVTPGRVKIRQLPGGG